MATNILTKDVKGTSFSPVEAGLTAVAKVAIEAGLSKVPFVGNGTVKSGIIKMVLAGLTGKFAGGNMFGRAAATGLIVDGGEDIVRGALGGALGLSGSGSGGSSEVGGNTPNQNAGVTFAI